MHRQVRNFSLAGPRIRCTTCHVSSWSHACIIALSSSVKSSSRAPLVGVDEHAAALLIPISCGVGGIPRCGTPLRRHYPLGQRPPRASQCSQRCTGVLEPTLVSNWQLPLKSFSGSARFHHGRHIHFALILAFFSPSMSSWTCDASTS